MKILDKFFGGKNKAIKFKCRQRGCEFEAENEPEFCPVCNNPANFEILDSGFKVPENPDENPDNPVT